MGNHSMKNKKPGCVLSIDPVFLANEYIKRTVAGKKYRVLMKRYEGNCEPNSVNRHGRLAARSRFRSMYGRHTTALVKKHLRSNIPMDTAFKLAMDELFAGRVIDHKQAMKLYKALKEKRPA